MPDTPIVVDRLTHRYKGAERPAIDGLSFRVERGEVVGLLGPNGAGKTSTLHAILGFLQPSAGRVLEPLPTPPVACAGPSRKPRKARGVRRILDRRVRKRRATRRGAADRPSPLGLGPPGSGARPREV